MSFAQSIACTARSRNSRQYRLKFHENGQRAEKAIEFRAPAFADALALALADPAERTVEIWEDGEFAIRISRDLPQQAKEQREADSLVKLLLDQPESDAVLICK